MNKILLLTDFSENARNAIKYAIQAFGQNVQYLLMHSFILKESSTYITLAHLEFLRKEIRGKLKNDLTFIRASFPEYPALRIKTIGEFGHPQDVLGMIEDQDTIDLVVMGNRGASGLQKLFVGCVAASVIKRAKSPVLTVPQNFSYTSFDKIVFASEFLEKQNEKVTDPLKMIAKRFKSELVLCKLGGKVKLTEDEVKQEIDTLKGSGYFEGLKTSWQIIQAKNECKSLEQFCKKNQAKLLVVIERHKKFFERLIRPDRTQQLIFHAEMPILVLPNLEGG